MRTYSVKASDLKPSWHVIDASGKTLGRLATEVAILLIGKHKPIYAPNMNVGDFVVVINSANVKVTGRKAEQKIYYRHSGYPSGLKSVTLAKMMETHPTRVIQYAVRGMLPKNRLRRQRLKRLKLYVGDMHPHQAQTGEARQGGSD